MSQKINPLTIAVIVIVVVIAIGFLGWKFAFTPDGVSGPPPKSASNPNGYAPPPSGAGNPGPPSAGR